MGKIEKRYLTMVLSEENVPWSFSSQEVEGVAVVAGMVEIPVGGFLPKGLVDGKVDELRYALSDLITDRELKKQEDDEDETPEE